MFSRLEGTPGRILWCYQGVLHALRGRVPERLERELAALTQELRSFVEGAGPAGA